jgi:hypothetical protein
MGKNNHSNTFYTNLETVSVKAPGSYSEEEGREASIKLRAYFDKVFDKTFKEIKIAYPDFICYRNGVKQ